MFSFFIRLWIINTLIGNAEWGISICSPYVGLLFQEKYSLKEPPDIVLTLREQITSDIQPPVPWGKALDDPLLNQPPVLSHMPDSKLQIQCDFLRLSWFGQTQYQFIAVYLHKCNETPSEVAYQENDVQFNAP